LTLLSLLSPASLTALLTLLSPVLSSLLTLPTYKSSLLLKQSSETIKEFLFAGFSVIILINGS
jgi:hypothetical protein